MCWHEYWNRCMTTIPQSLIKCSDLTITYTLTYLQTYSVIELKQFVHKVTHTESKSQKFLGKLHITWRSLEQLLVKTDVYAFVFILSGNSIVAFRLCFCRVNREDNYSPWYRVLKTLTQNKPYWTHYKNRKKNKLCLVVSFRNV